MQNVVFKSAKVTGIYVVILLLLLIFLFPFIWMIITAFKPSVDAIALPPIWNFSPTLSNFIQVLTNTTNGNFPKMLLNSVIVSFFTMVLGMITGTMAAFALARYSFLGRNFIGSWTLSTLMIPPTVSLIPIFLLVGQLHLTDTYIALIIPYTAFNLPLIIWMIRGFILDIPIELDESAMVEGCSKFQILWKIIFPLILPGIAATAIITVVQSWNEFLFALVLTRNLAMTAPVGINEYITMYGVEWGQMCAASLLITSPIIIFTILVRKNLVRGLTFGAVKG